jgi:hypothetical protein
MTNAEMPVERRKHKRFQVPQGAFVTLGPRGRVLGKIVDISVSGVAFGYIDGKKPSKGVDELDILFMDSGFSLRKVQFETMWNSEVPNEVCYNPEPMRRSGVEFKELESNQASELKCFIENHNVDNVVKKPSLYSIVK